VGEYLKVESETGNYAKNYLLYTSGNEKMWVAVLLIELADSM
jgi:hypothetical protein